MSDTPRHPCAVRCQYAQDVAMPEYSCQGDCMYEKAGPANERRCEHCDGLGYREMSEANGNSVTCHVCHGRGYVSGEYLR